MVKTSPTLLKYGFGPVKSLLVKGHKPKLMVKTSQSPVRTEPHRVRSEQTPGRTKTGPACVRTPGRTETGPNRDRAETRPGRNETGSKWDRAETRPGRRAERAETSLYHSCVFVYIRVYSCVFVCIRVYLCVFVCIRVYSCVFVCLRVYSCASASILSSWKLEIAISKLGIRN